VVRQIRSFATNGRNGTDERAARDAGLSRGGRPGTHALVAVALAVVMTREFRKRSGSSCESERATRGWGRSSARRMGQRPEEARRAARHPKSGGPRAMDRRDARRASRRAREVVAPPAARV
jgi:hypothetical protein